MKLSDKQLTVFLLTTQAVGIVFVAIFLSAYLGGMFMTPSTTVLHSDPAFRNPLYVFGVIFLILALLAVVLAVALKKD